MRFQSLASLTFKFYAVIGAEHFLNMVVRVKKSNFDLYLLITLYTHNNDSALHVYVDLERHL